MKNYNYKRVEQLFFLLVLVLSLIPVISFRYFPTLDGPAHLYNSNLINHLLSGSPEVLREFYVFNENIVPNWIGHAFLSVFNAFLPSYLAEKLLLLTYLIGLPITFRGLILSLNPKNLLVTYIIFPFSYSFPFFLGFYSFCLALVLMFAVLIFWFRSNFKDGEIRRYILLFLMLILLYFSHIFVFGITIIIIFGDIVYGYISIIRLKGDEKNITKRNLRRKFMLTLIAGILPISLAANFMLHREGVDEIIYLSFIDLLHKLTIVESIIVFDLKNESPYSGALFFFFLIIISTIIYTGIKAKKKRLQSFGNGVEKSTYSILFQKKNFWLLSSVFMLVLYFILPNFTKGGGYISLRLSLMFFLFLSIWISLNKIPAVLNFIGLIVVLFCHFSLLMLYNEHTKTITPLVNNCMLTADYIEEGKTVYPIYTYDYWFIQHISNYIGGDKPIVILENYECGQDHFPLCWNKNITTSYYINNDFKYGLNLSWLEKNSNTPGKIDYVLILGSLERVIKPELNEIKQYVIRDYKLHYKNDNCELYKLK